MFDWIWILVAGWVGFIFGFIACSLARMAAGEWSAEELEREAKEYYRT